MKRLSKTKDMLDWQFGQLSVDQYEEALQLLAIVRKFSSVECASGMAQEFAQNFLDHIEEMLQHLNQVMATERKLSEI